MDNRKRFQTFAEYCEGLSTEDADGGAGDLERLSRPKSYAVRFSRQLGRFFRSISNLAACLKAFR